MKKLFSTLLLAFILQSGFAYYSILRPVNAPETKRIFSNSVINNNRGTGTALSPVYLEIFNGTTSNYYFPFFLSIPYTQSYAFTFPDYNNVSVIRFHASSNFSNTEFLTLTAANGSVLWGQGQWGTSWVDLYNGNGPQNFIGGITIDVN